MNTTLLVLSLTVASLTGSLLLVPTRRIGGLTFWRIGRLGGSIYLARRNGGR
jgi:hypothetical protein